MSQPSSTTGSPGRDRGLLTLWKTIRSHEWWEFKIPPLLASAYATALLLHVDVGQLWPLLLLIIFALFSTAAYVCVLNDMTDLEEDRLSGKSNRLAGVPRGFQFLALAVCILPGLGAGWFMRHDPMTLSLFTANWIAFTFYSVPPIRLKTRGIGGVLMDASGSHLLPTLWASTLVAEANGLAIPFAFLATLGVWAAMLGLRGILWHQLYDRANDERGHVTTFAAGKNPDSIRRFVAYGTFPIEIIALFLILVQAGTAWAWVMLALYLLAEAMNRRMVGIDIILVQPTAHYRIIFAEYYQLQFPLTFLFALAQQSPGAAWLIVAQVVLFPRCLTVAIMHLVHVARWELAPSVVLYRLKLAFRRIRGCIS